MHVPHICTQATVSLPSNTPYTLLPSRQRARHGSMVTLSTMTPKYKVSIIKLILCEQHATTLGNTLQTWQAQYVISFGLNIIMRHSVQMIGRQQAGSFFIWKQLVRGNLSGKQKKHLCHKYIYKYILFLPKKYVLWPAHATPCELC